MEQIGSMQFYYVDRVRSLIMDSGQWNTDTCLPEGDILIDPC